MTKLVLFVAGRFTKFPTMPDMFSLSYEVIMDVRSSPTVLVGGFSRFLKESHWLHLQTHMTNNLPTLCVIPFLPHLPFIRSPAHPSR